MDDITNTIGILECCIDDKCYDCPIKYTDGMVACKAFDNGHKLIPTEIIRAVIDEMKQQHKTGEWIQFDEDSNTWECSECHTLQMIFDGTPEDNQWSYCPHCGADMRSGAGKADGGQRT
jgi:rubrerythrin